jgi:hypothetical protein
VEINWESIIRPLIDPPITIKPLSLYKPLPIIKKRRSTSTERA